ncbi:hypothetical protein Tco_0489157 [Tanacetum coccineum]
MHNDIMAVGSKERPPMLATRRYPQWQSCFLRYVDTKSNKKELRQCIFDGPYVMTEIIIPTKPTTATEEAVPEHNGESLNKQDVKTNLLWEFSKFTSRDGESIESYYSRSYKMINEITINKLEVATMQVNIQFLQQLQPEWLRFMTVNEVNDIRAEKLAKNENPLALVAATQQYPDDHYQAPKPHKTYALSSKPTPSTRSHDTTKNKGKEIVKPVTPPSESASEEDSDEEHA